MAALNVVVRVTLFAATVVVAAHVDHISSENEWLIKAQKTIKESLSNIETHGVEADKIQEMTNGAFDAFTKFTRTGLSDIIRQTNGLEPEEMSALRGQLVHWSRSLGRLNRSDLPNDNSVYTALSKFRITIDYICREAAQFDKKYHFESEKSKRIVEELAKLTTEAVLKLVEYSRSIEDQVYGYYNY